MDGLWFGSTYFPLGQLNPPTHKTSPTRREQVYDPYCIGMVPFRDHEILGRSCIDSRPTHTGRQSTHGPWASLSWVMQFFIAFQAVPWSSSRNFGGPLQGHAFMFRDLNISTNLRMLFYDSILNVQPHLGYQIACQALDLFIKFSGCYISSLGNICPRMKFQR